MNFLDSLDTENIDKLGADQIAFEDDDDEPPAASSNARQTSGVSENKTPVGTSSLVGSKRTDEQEVRVNEQPSGKKKNPVLIL
jgi:hypothetical protein